MAGPLPTLDDLLEKLMSIGGSDLHLKVGSPPAYRIDGQLQLSDLEKLTPADTDSLLEQVIPERLRPEFTDTNEADFAYGKASLGRFRVNCYRQRGSVNIVIRAVAPTSPTLADLGLPTVVEKLCDEMKGLTLVTGPAGSGKTTTVGALLDRVNSSHRVNIITLEDPIEILHRDKLSIVSQREVGVDTVSFHEGLRRVLRQDPDVIFIGEMRDKETVEAALLAAESGRLVISTLLTTDAAETVNRIVEFFPPYQERHIRQVLAGALSGVISQKLLPRADGKGRIPAIEVLVNNDRVFERIVDGERTHTLVDVIADGSYYGMESFDQSILRHYQEGEVTFQDALAHATDPSDFKLAAQNRGLMSA